MEPPVTAVNSLAEQFKDVKERIHAAAKLTGRTGKDILLVAVSKYAGMDEVRELIAMGQRDFAENQVQQLQQRAAMITEWQQRQRGLAAAIKSSSSGGAVSDDTTVRWHMIGHLQRNKVRKAAELARLIHSVDSLRVAEELQAAAMRMDRTIDVLIQVNASGEGTKFGVLLPAAIHLAEQMDSMVNLRVRGLMTMAPHDDSSPTEARLTFSRTRELFEEMKRIGVVGPAFNILSMGMTGDYEIAISEGANLVRVGSGIFGHTAPQSGDDSSEDDADRAQNDPDQADDDPLA
ncbi:MAG: YggS family pyridoxal phosphate-dependent enzyme [Phycisphaerales bacterium]|nr:YggS family pyridoxal phosphate-dependent enzyme [Phycisphaerales bacterium]